MGGGARLYLPAYRSVCLFCLPASVLSVCFVCASVYFFGCLSICLPVCPVRLFPFVCMCVCLILSACLSCPFDCVCVCVLSACLSCPFVLFCASVCLLPCVSVSLPACLFLSDDPLNPNLNINPNPNPNPNPSPSPNPNPKPNPTFQLLQSRFEIILRMLKKGATVPMIKAKDKGIGG
jgi:hypothetical protein